MDEIAELQRQLMEVQNTESIQKLSERNCVDIVQKIIKMKGFELLNTLSGVREFVTPDQLEYEIIQYLDNNGGRIQFDELEEILNIDITYIQKKTKEILEKNPNIRLLDRQLLISEKYIHNLIKRVEDILNGKGIVTLTSISSMMDLPLDFIEKITKEKLIDTKKYYYVNGNIYTENHFTQQKRKLKGLLCGCVYPIQLDILSRKFGFDSSIFGEITQSVIKELNGHISKGIYFPAIFSVYQRKIIEDFYNSNLYYEYSSAKTLYITNITELKEIIPNCMELSTVVIHKQLFETFVASIEELSKDYKYIEISKLLPTNLSDKDI